MMCFPGNELYRDSTLGTAEKWYCCFMGAPIIGLRIRLRRLRGLLPASATAVLDAGCGRGVITRFLARRFRSAQIDGIDENESEQRINQTIANDISLGNCHFTVADVLRYRKPDHYDLIVSVDNLEHVENDMAALVNFHVSLREAGMLVVHVPHYYRRWPVFRWTVNFNVPGHVRPGYHLPELTEHVRRAGFTVLQSGFSYGWLENLVNNIAYAISGAREKRRLLYAMLFPLLNCLAWLGQWTRPQFGAGIWVVAKKTGQVRQQRMDGRVPSVSAAKIVDV
jgi:SAM-dependent methyltransferase